MDRTDAISACFLAFSVWVYLTISLKDKTNVANALWVPTMIAMVISLVALFGKLNENSEQFLHPKSEINVEEKESDETELPQQPSKKDEELHC